MQTATIEPERIAYSIKEAAKISSLSRSTIYNHIRSNRLRVTRLCGRTLVPASALRELIEGEDA